MAKKYRLDPFGTAQLIWVHHIPLLPRTHIWTLHCRAVNIWVHHIPLLPSPVCQRAECQTQSPSVCESRYTSTVQHISRQTVIRLVSWLVFHGTSAQQANIM